MLARVDRISEAYSDLSEVLELAVEEKRFRLASGVAGELVSILEGMGRLDEALIMAGRKAQLSSWGGLGPWTRILDESKVHGVLLAQGEYQAVLEAVEKLDTSNNLAV